VPRSLRLPGLVYAALGLALWPVPLFGLLHVEASAVVAAAGFFVGGVSAARAFRRGARFRSVLVGHLLLLAIPWALLTATLLWRPNCGYAAGLGFYLLFAPPSVVLGASLAYALTATRLRRPGLALVGVGLLVAVGGVAFDLGLHPQFYTYSHVFGGVLGPIYDEELAVRPGLFVFRALTLLWAALGYLAGRWLRLRGQAGAAVLRRRVVAAGAAVMVALALAYALRFPLGLNTSAAQLARALPGRYDGGAFVVHYDPDALTAADLGWIVDEHRYRLARLRATLGVGVGGTMHTYLYPDPTARGRLTGSRETGVTPVWLATPQVHLLQDRFTAEHFGHELAHVVSRAFGAPPLRASPAVGLVEGLAVAVQPPDGLPDATQQVAASLRLDETLGALDAGPAGAVAAALSPWGFWTGRGAVSYATSGAFVGWLLDRYGAERLRAVYRTADFAGVYGVPAAALAEAWEADLRGTPVSVEAESLAAWRFRQPSLFEQRCPHHVPPAVRLTRAAAEAAERGEGEASLRLYEAALDADPAYRPALTGWAARALAEGVPPDEVLGRLLRPSPVPPEEAAPDPALNVALGDALRLQGRSRTAENSYERAIRELPPYAWGSRASVQLRRRLSPGALRALLAAGPPERRAAGLEAVGPADPAAGFFAAALWLEAGDPARALALLERLPNAVAPDAETRRALLGFRAQAADRARAYERVPRYAREAAAAFRAAGEESRARLMDDLAAKAAWMPARGGA
jgi:tetratricopeptide (TPR) repeat protein